MLCCDLCNHTKHLYMFARQTLIDEDVISLVVSALDKGEFKVQREAVWVITNFTSGGSVEQIVDLINKGVLEPLFHMLLVEDAKTVMVALDAVNNLLLVCIIIVLVGVIQNILPRLVR